MEYKKAKNRDPKKILIYLKKEVDGEEIEVRQQEFRDCVQDFLFGYYRHIFFDSINQLKSQITRDIASWITSRLEQGRQDALKVGILEIENEAYKKKEEFWSNSLFR